MHVYLVQHGEAKSKDEDRDRPLTDRGRRDVRKVAARLAAAEPDVRRIVHSGKTRARQTADLLAEGLGAGGPGEVESDAHLGPTDDTSIWADRVDGGADGVMLVGHLPFMERIAARLVAGDAESPVVTFSQGGVLRLAREDGGEVGWTVRWFVTPPVA